MELLIWFSSMGLMAFWYQRKLTNQEDYLLAKMGKHLLNSGWGDTEIMREIDSHRFHTLDLRGRTKGQYLRRLADHLEVARRSQFVVDSREKEKMVSRIHRSIEIIAFSAGWDSDGLNSLSERILKMRDQCQRE